MSAEQARLLDYLYQEREKVIAELGGRDWKEYPWTLETRKQMLTEEIHAILNKLKREGKL